MKNFYTFKRFTVAFLLLFTFIFGANSQVQIGNGNSTGNALPIEPFYGYSISQQIYLASEINANGTITSLQFYFDGSTLEDSDAWKIYLGHTTKTSFSSTSDWVSFSSLTQVYSDSIANPTSTGWITIDITDWTYNGTDNLLIAVLDTAPSYDGSSDEFHCTATTNDRAIEDHQDSAPFDESNPPTGTTKAYIPNVILGGLTQSCPTPTAFSASNISTTGLDLSWTSSSSNSNIEYGLSGFTQGAGTMIHNVSSPTTITGLTAGQTYDFYVQDSCSATDLSSWYGPITVSIPLSVNSPYFQDFESFTTQNGFTSENGWTGNGPGANDIDIVNAGDLDVGSPYSGTVAVELNDGAFDSDDTSAFISPILSGLSNADKYIKFYANAEDLSCELYLATLNSANDISSMQIFDTITFTNSDQWNEIIVPLTNSSIVANANHIAFIHGPTSYEIGLDDFSYYLPLTNDLAIQNLNYPSNLAIDFTSSSAVEVEVKNNGTNPQSGFDVKYSVDGSAFVSENVSSSITPNGSLNYTFNTTADFSGAGNHTITVVVSNSGDLNSSNDTMSFNVYNESLPYSNNFDNLVEPNLPESWSVINSTSSGYIESDNYETFSGGMAIDFYNSSASSSEDLLLVMPEFFGSYSTTRVNFAAFNEEIAEYFIVGVLTDPTDASTFTAIDTVDFSASDAWEQFSVDLFNYTGAGNYIAFKHGCTDTYTDIYLDDVELVQVYSNDLSITNITAPTSGISLTSHVMKIEILNSGLTAQSNFPVSFSDDNGTTYTTEIVSSTINSGDTYTHTFTATADVSATAYNDIIASVALSNDQNNTNDTLLAQVYNYPYPYLENFDTLNVNILPLGYMELNETSAGYVEIDDYKSVSQPNSLDIYNSSAGSGENLFAILPYLNQNINNVWMTYDLYSESTDDSVIVGVFTDPTDVNTFTGVDTLVFTDNNVWNSYYTSFSGYSGSGKYIAFKHTCTDTYEDMYIDNLIIEDAPTGPVYTVNEDTVDMGQVRFNFNDTTSHTVTIQNTGMGNMNITQAVLSGTNAANFVLVDTNSYPVSIGTYETISFDVEFAGSAIGSKTANIDFNVDGNSKTILLNAEVVDATINSFPYVENFDDQAVDLGWELRSNDGDFLWEYDYNTTGSSSTGPSQDVTGGYYIYSEASGAESGDVAEIFIENTIDLSSLTNPQMNYWYHMYGVDIDTFAIEAASGGVWNQIDLIVGEQMSDETDPWIMKSIDLSAYTTIDSMRIYAIGTGGYYGDIAIDNIAFGENFDVNLGPDTAVCGQSVSLTGVASDMMEWTDMSDTSVIANTQNVVITNSGTYAFSAYDNGYFGGSDTIMVNLESIPQIIISENDTICSGEETEISVSSNPVDPFFSEYQEGSSNNKVVEIYNGTGSTIQLDNYKILTNYNGGSWSGMYDFPVGSTIANGDMFIIANKDADTAITNHADDTLAYNEKGYMMGYNGDDVRALVKFDSNGDTIIVDMIGLYDLTDPGSGWEVAGISNATKDHTLIRKPTAGPNYGNFTQSQGIDSVSSEWMVYPQNTWTNVGTHSFTPTGLPSTYDVVWSNGSLTAIDTVSPTTTTTYTVNVSMPNSTCSAIDSVEIMVYQSPVVDLGSDTTIKWKMGSITLDAGAGFSSYNWSDGSSSQTLVVDSNITVLGANTYWVEVTNSNNCSASDTIVITTSDDTGIDDITKGNIKIYPNPTNGKFYISLNELRGQAEINIINSTGKVLYRKSINVTNDITHEIDASSFAQGIYYVQINTIENRFSYKIIVR